ncbi:MAG TPA: ATPase, T2SS/T4P/T4SS family [Planctomycetota bacterium]|nr:ATPase, T2SS/T4P/T4SS family [Planctomycetota bacterium]
MGRGNGQAGDVAKYLSAIGASSLAREDLVVALTRRNAGDPFDVDGLALLPDLLRMVPEDLALENRILPVHRSGDILFVAVPDGSPREGLEELEHLLGLRVEPVAVSEIDVPGLLVKAHQLLRRRNRSSAPSTAAASGGAVRGGPDLDHLGVPEPILSRLRAALSASPGLILLGGPAGSGKTTTMAALAGDFRRRGLRAVSFDRTHGVAALEEALEADPDAVLVDETASPAMASRALRAAVEGRRVLMAFQAPDALSALARLAALQVDSHLLATATKAGLNQRLLRGVCPDCADVRPEDPVVLEDLRLDGLLGSVPLRLGRGCSACGKTGTRGQVAVFEYGERSTDGGLREGFSPLVADALGKLVAGRISLSELTQEIPFTQILQAADRLNVRKISP